MRNFKEGDTIYVEPFRARAFPVIRDLVVDRSALDALIRAGGYVSVHTGGVPDANAVLVPREDAEEAMDAAECIGCGACVAACPNGAAMLVTAGEDRAPRRAAAGARRGGAAGLRDDRRDAAPGFRALQQPLRVRGGLPEGDQGALYRQTEP